MKENDKSYKRKSIFKLDSKNYYVKLWPKTPWLGPVFLYFKFANNQYRYKLTDEESFYNREIQEINLDDSFLLESEFNNITTPVVKVESGHEMYFKRVLHNSINNFNSKNRDFNIRNAVSKVVQVTNEAMAREIESKIQPAYKTKCMIKHELFDYKMVWKGFNKILTNEDGKLVCYQSEFLFSERLPRPLDGTTLFLPHNANRIQYTPYSSDTFFFSPPYRPKMGTICLIAQAMKAKSRGFIEDIYEQK